ncbi:MULTISPECIES: hypothetical protein [unclassified Nocardioides]|uniref:hypothetical protein n=1 Tax=unclassified Nocardioides TaxID=2615069 RepID=UPI00114FCC3D|nr:MULTISPECIES: hypothetical protein [unclassified Nocardioides]TQK70264.1 hypothetical protein FBY23_2038 [Nocardioides sp. SLBN-35]WGY00509.1 hypothetical protein QI633_18420 [Nocardioides sp. QY071]
MASRTLLLRPGTPVLTRSPGVLQVGLVEPSIRLPDIPAVRDLLEGLARPAGHAPADALPTEAATALARLLDAGLAVPAGDVPAHLLAQAGSDAVRRPAARAASPVALDAPPGARAVLGPLLAAAGLVEAEAPEDATVRLVIGDGPLARERLDPLVRASVPHLLVGGDARGVRIGPFVVPGRTACLRCVDAHESLHDQRLPLLLAQAARHSTQRPPPRDPVLDRLALAWAVRDLTGFVDGEEPSTWSTTVDLGPSGAPVLTRWGRHPWCGCAWDGFLDLP